MNYNKTSERQKICEDYQWILLKHMAEELNIGRHQAEAAVKLIDEGNTIPFIARYRKEATGSLNDEVLRNLDERLKYLRNLEEQERAGHQCYF